MSDFGCHQHTLWNGQCTGWWSDSLRHQSVLLLAYHPTTMYVDLSFVLSVSKRFLSFFFTKSWKSFNHSFLLCHRRHHLFCHTPNPHYHGTQSMPFISLTLSFLRLSLLQLLPRCYLKCKCVVFIHSLLFRRQWRIRRRLWYHDRAVQQRWAGWDDRGRQRCLDSMDRSIQIFDWPIQIFDRAPAIPYKYLTSREFDQCCLCNT